MIIDEKKVKRLIAYFIYDKQGIVDDYIIYMLCALKEHSSEIAVVVNGKLTSESREKLNLWHSWIQTFHSMDTPVPLS